MIILPLGIYGVACSSSSNGQDEANNPADPGSGGDNPSGGGAPTPDAGVDLTVNPIDGIDPAVSVLETDAYTDGAAWHIGQQVLYFTTPLGTGALYRMRVDGSVMKVADGDATTGDFPIGNAVDTNDNGNLYMVNAFDITRTNPMADSGAPEMIANGYMVGGVLTKFDSLKAAVVRKDGTIYATDPGYASVDGPAQNRIYQITPDKQVNVADSFDDIPRPNGIALSPDQTELYVGFTEPQSGSLPYIRKYHLNDDGTLGESLKWTEMDALDSTPDGVEVDQGGNVYVATQAGIAVYKSDGTKIGVIAVPEWPTTMAFGGPDLKTMFITTQNSKIWKVTINIPGIAQ